MNTISYGLLIGLAIALVIAAFTDMRRRQIDNWLNALIALTAPAFWWASGLDLWPGVAIQLGVATAAFFILAGLFAMKVMGGGDVKLLTALALWVPPYVFMQLLLIMSLAGGALTIVLAGWHIIRGERDKIKIPYGIAIAFGGLWVLWANYLPGVSFAAQAA
ncbi:MAG: prepilin peptidase [Erythrobacter sp.]